MMDTIVSLEKRTMVILSKLVVSPTKMKSDIGGNGHVQAEPPNAYKKD